MEAESNTEALGLETVNVYDGNGNILDNNTTMEKDEIATTLNKYELTQIHYIVQDRNGETTAECDITGQNIEDLSITIY
ncbi:hypothetical protein AQV86_03770 [Nanohaloarchaea archaeon SG9]|nr:hypothetical protein AQV86_03770 [Nanohaloarchaea archaeon SG9]